MSVDRVAPGIRLQSLPSERARSGVPVDLTDRVLQFTFEDSIHRSDKVSLQLDNSDLSLFDRAELSSGALWEVSWGYPGAMAPARRLVVKKMQGFESLTLEANSLGLLMDQQTRSRTFRNKTRGQVAQEIGREHGFDGVFLDADDEGEVMDTIVQAGESDARFLRRLAHAEGKLFYVDETGLHFHPRRAVSGPVRRFVWRDPENSDVLSIQVETNLAARVGRVEVRGRDLLSKQDVGTKATKDTAKRPTLAPIVEVTEPVDGETGFSARIVRIKTAKTETKPGATAKGAQAAADASFVRSEAPSVKMSMQILGDPAIRAGDIVEVAGVGRRLSGMYRLVEAKHTISSSGYTCDLALRSDGTSAAVGDASGRHGAAQGGSRQKSTARKPGALEMKEFVFGEDGRTIKLFVPSGDPPGAHDPEAQQR
jgi:phage protein D